MCHLLRRNLLTRHLGPTGSQARAWLLLAPLALCVLLWGVAGCTLRSRAKLSSTDQLEERQQQLLGRLSGELSAGGVDLSVLTAMTLDQLEALAHLYPDLLETKSRVEDRLLEILERGQTNQDVVDPEPRMALVGRVELRRQSSDAGAAKEPFETDLMIVPDRAAGRLMAALQMALGARAGVPSNSDSDLALHEQVYRSWYGDKVPPFVFVRCAPRFDPGQYVEGSGDLVAGLVRSLTMPKDAPRPERGPEGRSREDSALEAGQAGVDIHPPSDCAAAFGSNYSRWEMDFFLVRARDTNGALRYYQEIQVRTRVFWATRLLNGPLNGKPELQRTLIFRSREPLPQVAHLRVFGNLQAPRPLTIYNHNLDEPFDEKTRDAILANFGVRMAAIKTRIMQYAADRGIDVQVRSGQTVDDLTALFKLARIWNFFATARRNVLQASSSAVAVGLLANGYSELSSYALVDALLPSNLGHAAVTAFSKIVVPGAVLTRRAVDTLEIDYLVSVVRASEQKDSPVRRWMDRLQIFDFAMAGVAVADGALFAADNWNSLVSTFYTTHVIRALSEAWTVYRNGLAIPRELYGPLLREQAMRSRRKRHEVQKLISDTRNRLLADLAKTTGKPLDLVDRLTRLSEELRNLHLYASRATQEDAEARAARVDEVLDLVVRRAYCDVLSSPDLVAALTAGDPPGKEVTTAPPPSSAPRAAGQPALEALGEAHGCPSGEPPPSPSP